jgi:N-acetylneuraminate synthase
MNSTFFISEVSSNHNGDINRSLNFIDVASRIGCQAVKFQLFKVDELFAPEILEKSKDLRDRTNWELPLGYIPQLADKCRKNGIEFACTPFYLDAVKELEPYVDFYKIASYELLWDDLLKACAKTGKPIILSTGMSTNNEINHAVDVLRKSGCLNPTLLHCNSAYPTPVSDSNLAAIKTIRENTNCAVGWSDHTADPAVIYRAIHKWDASVIEFHLDIDGDGEEFASGHCWLPDQIRQVIENVNKGFTADGNGVKKPSISELPDREWRADPTDGLRPLKEIRATWKP